MAALISIPINDKPRNIKAPLVNDIGFTFGTFLNIDFKPFTGFSTEEGTVVIALIRL